MHAMLLASKVEAEKLECSFYTLLHDTLEGVGFLKIGSGCYRTGFTHPSVPGVIFKVEEAWDAHYNPMAKIEYDLYHRTATPADRERLAECYCYHESVCVMEFVEGVRMCDLRESEAYPAYRKFWSIYNRNLLPRNYSDAGYHNLMLTPDGRAILFDYTIN